jgi:hypothetical protein
MKALALLIIAGAAAIFSQSHAEWDKWFPDSSTRWNLFALRESGLGRMLSRAMTKDADHAWHHGMTEPKPAEGQNALSRWIDKGVISLGFQGRLTYRPPAKYPIRPSEVIEVLEKTEKDLSAAFTLDPGNYDAYDAYVMFLTTKIRETEFGSMDGKKETPDEASNTDEKSGSGGDDDDDLAAVQRFRQWERNEQRQRNLRAVAVTDYAISRFSPRETEPERYLGLAMVYYNRFALLAPDVPSRKSSFLARRLLETQALATVKQMERCSVSAQLLKKGMIESGVWSNRSAERLNDYQQVEQMVEKYIDVLYQTMVNNRSLDVL